jgi:hypothetical protein
LYINDLRSEKKSDQGRIREVGLALALQRLSRDWQSRYGHPLWLVETFVETDRFVGTAYQAAGWSGLGQTTGRTRQDRRHALQTPPKTVWVRPLHSRFREVLCAL